jgi:hypothetical protein
LGSPSQHSNVHNSARLFCIGVPEKLHRICRDNEHILQ